MGLYHGGRRVGTMGWGGGGGWGVGRCHCWFCVQSDRGFPMVSFYRSILDTPVRYTYSRTDSCHFLGVVLHGATFHMQGSRGEIAVLASVSVCAGFCPCVRICLYVRALSVYPGFVVTSGFCLCVRVLSVCSVLSDCAGFVSVSGFCLCVRVLSVCSVLSVCAGFVRVSGVCPENII